MIRSDTTFAFYENTAGDSGSSVASFLLASYKVASDLAPLVRIGVVNSSPPEGAVEGAAAVTNPLVGLTYAPKLHPAFKLAFFFASTIPIGSGGGETYDRNVAAALAPAGIFNRSAMDNAMFVTNYQTTIPGIDLAYVAGGFTAQLEGTILVLTKTRGPKAADDSNVNFTSGAHVGYFVIPMLSIGAELRHQRWLTTPTAVSRDASRDATRESRDNTTFAIGPRFHFKLGETTWLRPGIAYTLPLDNPMSKGKYKIVQLDVPFAF